MNKPCMNDKCIENNTISESRCNLYDRGCIGLNKIIDCYLYTPKKIETAWEMFRRLRKECGGRLLAYIQKKLEYKMPKYLNCMEIIYRLVEERELEVIKIMKEIEKELKE